jgi:hypothetical protein
LTSDITVPHAVDQLVARKTDMCWCIVPEKGKHLRGHCKHKSKNSFSSGTEYGETSECLHSGEWWALEHLLWTVFQVLLYCSIAKWNFGCVLK